MKRVITAATKRWPSKKTWFETDLYEEDEMWQDYLAGPEDEINTKYQIFPEPSVQGGVGSMFIYDESGNPNMWEVDFGDWSEKQIEMAASSTSAAQYKKKYEEYIRSILGDKADSRILSKSKISEKKKAEQEKNKLNELAKYSTDAAQLIELSDCIYDEVRGNVAKNPNTPASILAKFANDEIIYIREYVAKNPSTPVDLLIKLANDEDKDVRENVANNPNTPTDVLVKLANDESEWVRLYVIDNPNTSLDVLMKLANDEDSWVRGRVAQNLNTPTDVLMKLANDESASVRRYVSRNPNYNGN